MDRCRPIERGVSAASRLALLGPSRRLDVRSRVAAFGRSVAVASLPVLVCMGGLVTPALAQVRTRVEGLAALVGGATPGPGVDALLLSDVTLRARMRLAGEAPESPLPLGPLPAGLVRATLDEQLGELLIAREATRVRVRVPQAADVARERAHLEAESGGAARLDALLRALGATPAEVDALAAQQALVAAFFAANLEGVTEIADAEVERLYLAGDHPFVDMTLDEAREPLRIQAAQAALERAVSRWVTVLRGRITHRILLREP
jgi:hypothetical protein